MREARVDALLELRVQQSGSMLSIVFNAPASGTMWSAVITVPRELGCPPIAGGNADTSRIRHERVHWAWV